MSYFSPKKIMKVMVNCGAPPIAAHHHLLVPQIRNQTTTETTTTTSLSRNWNRRSILLSSSSLFLLLPIPTIINPSSSSSYATETVETGKTVPILLFDPVSPAEREASAVITSRVEQAVDLLEKGKDLQAQGDFNGALNFFTKVVEDYKEFALSDYARVGRAIALYEVGDRDIAIAEMEDISISLKGYPEVHAALAAALYGVSKDKNLPNIILLAENQFTLATLLDPNYTDLSYVRLTKHWPPTLVTSLRNFITLT